VLSSTAIVVAYAYRMPRWHISVGARQPCVAMGGLVLVTLGACLSIAASSVWANGSESGRLAGLATRGPYRLVRHPMYLAYVLADIGLQPPGMEFRDSTAGDAGWASCSTASCRRADTLSTCRMVDLLALVRHRSSPPLVGGVDAGVIIGQKTN